jgi:hypothetical protein
MPCLIELPLFLQYLPNAMYLISSWSVMSEPIGKIYLLKAILQMDNSMEVTCSWEADSCSAT